MHAIWGSGSPSPPGFFSGPPAECREASGEPWMQSPASTSSVFAPGSLRTRSIRVATLDSP